MLYFGGVLSKFVMWAPESGWLCIVLGRKTAIPSVDGTGDREPRGGNGQQILSVLVRFMR